MPGGQPADDEPVELDRRRVLLRPGKRWIEEGLSGQCSVTGVTQPQCDRGRKVPAGALPGHGHGGHVPAEGADVGQRPPGHRFAVVQSGRIGILRREAVADRHHDGARRVRELTRDTVHDPDAADDEAPTVEVRDHPGRLALTLVDPDRDVTDLLVMDVCHLPGRRRFPGPAGQLQELRREVLDRCRKLGVGGDPLGHPGVEDALFAHALLMSASPSAGYFQLGPHQTQAAPT